MKALITWWTKGIWYAIAENLAKQWYDIVMTYLHDHGTAKESQERLKAFSKEVVVIQADSSSREDINRIFEQEKGFTVLINNVWSPFPSEGWSDRNAMFQYHMMWTVYATELFAQHLEWTWSIINISSVLWQDPFAWYKWARLEAYCCIKSAVDMYTKLSANKFAGKIQVNAVSPWNTNTPAWQWADESFVKAREDNSCIKRFIDPDEIGRTVAMIVINQWINGQVIVVDWWTVARWYE